MKKAEAEAGIRSAVYTWARETGVSRGQSEMPDFNEFVRWMQHNGYPQYFEFASTMGPWEDAERWFDEELGQTWRN